MRDGYTLVELVIVILIVGIIAGTFVRYIDEGTRMYQQVETRKSLMMEGRQALLRTVREIRQVRSPTDVVSASATGLSFYGVDDSLYAFAYSGVPGADLVMSRGSVSAPVATGVDSLAFSYYQSDGGSATPVVSPGATDIFRVGIFLRLAHGSDVVSLQTATFVRNVQ